MSHTIFSTDRASLWSPADGCRHAELDRCRLERVLRGLLPLTAGPPETLLALGALALQDDLTGLYNRRGFRLMAAEHALTARRRPRQLRLVLIDIDDFKTINDRHGHLVGDAVLTWCAQSMRAIFPRADVLARVGGDEFAVLSISGTGCRLPSRLAGGIRRRSRAVGRPVAVSVSVGMARCDPRRPLMFADLYRLADRRLYAQKRRRKTGIEPMPPRGLASSTDY
jgi:diguanylate cyclase (GGDEF)-like protein